MKRTVLILFSLLVFVNLSTGLKILTVYSFPSKSNSLLGESLVRHLAEAGHEITHITAFPPVKPVPNVTIIDVSYNWELFDGGDVLNFKEIFENPVQEDTLQVLNMMLHVSNLTVGNPNVVRLLNNKKLHFDLVIVEWLYNEIYAGFSAVYECPLIWFSATEPNWLLLKITDGLPNPSYIPGLYSDYMPPFSIRQRVLEFCHLVWGIAAHAVYYWRTYFDVYSANFGPILQNRGRELVEYRDLMYNASLVLSNTHASMGSAMVLPQNVIPIAGFHIDKNVKPLPQDLQKIMDDSIHGVIYFSMGATLQGIDMPDTVRMELLTLFSGLKETVLWKYEGEYLPNRPSNVHLIPWAPQQSILAHKRCVLFITHGGHLSITEAVHFGVPIIGVPIYGDQFANVNRAVAKGFAKKVTMAPNLAEKLGKAIWELRTFAKYRNKMKEVSLSYHDRPVPPSKELVHWVEHVAKTRGAFHLRSPSLLVTWNHRYGCDLLVLCICFYYITYDVIYKHIYPRIFK